MDNEKLKKYLMDNEKCSAEEADKKLAGMDDEEKKELSAKMSNAEEAPDTADKDKSNLSKLSNAEDAPDSDSKTTLSEEDQKMKSYLMDKQGMDEKDADSHLRDMEDAEKKSLKKRMTDDEKKLADVEIEVEDDKKDEERLSNAEEAPDTADKDSSDVKGNSTLSADVRAKLTKLAKNIKKTSGEVSLSSRKAQLAHKLNQLRMSAKITPAEIKKFDLDKLAKMSKESRDAVMRSYEDREPVIPVGLMGNTKAEELTEVSQSVVMAQLEAETRGNMTMFSKGQKSQKIQPINSNVKLGSDLKPVYRADFDSICRLMDEGNTDGAKKALRKFIDAGNVLGKSLNDEVQLSGLAEKVQSLQNDLNEIFKAIGIEA